MRETINKISAGGVIYNNGKVLAIKWFSMGRTSIEFPKGAIEPNETKEEACIREVQEETGYKTRIIKPLGDITFEFDWSDGKHYRKTVYHYLLELINDDEPIPNREADETFENMWLTIEEAKHQLTFDTDKEILERALQNI